MNNFDVFYKNALIPPPEERNEVIKYTRIAVDSKDRDKSLFPNANKYEIKLSNEIVDVISAKLINADIPLSMYMINQYFDTVVVQVGSTTYNVQLDHGDYNESQLATLLTDSINTTIGSNVFSVTYNTNKDNFTFASSQVFSLDFNEGPNNLADLLGFDKVTYTSTNGGSAPYTNIITSDYRKNFKFNNYIIMYIDHFDVYQSPTNDLDRCFAIIPVEYDRLSISDKNDLKKVFSPPVPRMTKLIISFFDRYGNPYDFNNINHRFELLIKSHKHPRKYNQIYADRDLSIT